MRAKICKTAKQCRICQTRRLRDYAEHIAQKHLWKRFATKSTTCKVTVRPQMWFSVNHCSLSSGLSVEEAAASYALNRIKSYQVQMMSPVLLIHVSLTFIHASPRTNPVVYAEHIAKKNCGKALQQNPPRARSQCDPRYGSLSIIAACPQDSRSKRQPPTRSTGSNHIKSK